MDHSISKNQNEIAKNEHDETYQVKKVSNFVSDGEGNLVREQAMGFVDTSNSTSTPLGIDGVFTGSSIDITQYGIIFVNVYTDVVSATDGLMIEQSSDGINWDHDDVYTVPAGGAKNYSINPFAQYMRVSYTNGGSAQGSFRLQTILKANSKPSSHRIQDAIIDEDDAELVKAVLTAKQSTDGFVNIEATASNNLRVTDAESGLAIAKGDVVSTGFVHKFGNAPDFDTADGKVSVWDGADDSGINEMTYTYSTTAAIDSLSSSSASDTVDIEVQGLDSGYNVVNQTITLTGQTRVALTTNLIRVFRMKNVGSTNLVGNVYCYENVATTGGVPNDTSLIRAVIDNGNNQTLMAIYTVPAGKTAYMRDWYASTAGASKGTAHEVDLFARPFGQVFQLKHRSSIDNTGTSYIQHEYQEPEVFSEKTDLEMRVNNTASNITEASVSAGFDIVLIDN